MTVRWGFLGAGWIADRAMAPAVHAAGNARLEAVASREPLRAAALGPVRVHASYADLLDDPDVDAVYVCLANHQHEEWTMRALSAGKHVLCEKPLALDRAQAERMALAAVEADRLLVEAVWCRWHPRHRRLAELATSGQLGEVLSVDSAFTFPGEATGSYRSVPGFGGGALLDVGGYQVHAWTAMAGCVPQVRIDRVERTLGSTGIDVTTRVAASVGAAGRATAVASFVLPEHQYLVVTGRDAVARMGEGAAFTTWQQESTLVIGDHVETFPAADAYRLMVEAVGDRIGGGSAWCVPLDESVGVCAILDEVRAHP